MPEHRPPPRPSTMRHPAIEASVAPELADHNPWGRLIVDIAPKNNGMMGILSIRLDPVGHMTPGIIEQHMLTISQAILHAHALNKGHIAVKPTLVEKELEL